MQWGIPQTGTGASRKQRQGPSLRARCGILSCIEPKPFLAIVSVQKYGPLIRVIQALGGQGTSKVEALEHDFIQAVTPYMHENLIRQDYLLTLALKA